MRGKLTLVKLKMSKKLFYHNTLKCRKSPQPGIKNCMSYKIMTFLVLCFLYFYERTAKKFRKKLTVILNYWYRVTRAEHCRISRCRIQSVSIKSVKFCKWIKFGSLCRIMQHMRLSFKRRISDLSNTVIYARRKYYRNLTAWPYTVESAVFEQSYGVEFLSNWILKYRAYFIWTIGKSARSIHREK